jgi:peptidoglycan hydrolase-like protein with peptidoglycan-binding domain
VLGGFKQGSHKEYGITTGQQVEGRQARRVLGSYGMVHLETYEAEGRKANSVWWKGEPPPDGLLNPTNYVERMVGDKVSLLQTRQRHEALKTLGYYTGDVGAPWGTASTEALRAAQQALGVEVDGKWGPNTEDAIQRALAEKQGCTSDECAAADTGDETADNSDAVGAMGRLGWVVMGADRGRGRGRRGHARAIAGLAALVMRTGADPAHVRELINGYLLQHAAIEADLVRSLLALPRAGQSSQGNLH